MHPTRTFNKTSDVEILELMQEIQTLIKNHKILL